MGKAARWLRSFLAGKKGKGKGRDDGGSLPSLPAPAAKEKRRWSFRRPAPSVSGRDTISTASGYQGHGQLASTSSSHCFSADVHVVASVQEEDQLEHAAVPVPPPAEATIVATSVNGGNAEEAAAVRIQSAFRSYLARRALCALRGMVKLQAMVRGQLVRRQADATLRRIQALVAAQRRARAERLRLRLIEDGGAPASRRSPQHYLPHRSPRKTVAEADGARHSSCCSTPGKGDPYSRHNHKASPATQSENTSARTFSDRFEEEHYSASAASFSAAGSEASWRHHRGHAHASASYMANTESSRAKQARSHSAPRHRPEPTSPSPSGRRRASLDPRDLAAGQVGQARAPSPGRSSVDARGAREAER
ncbi:protein IQ-DOMAIN 19-like [Lolium rigidum]|uniref:protein IQ-DOMAIN 19-like n=1 Tax=Lolium rigidum TaxID=89674 RepID=UPI001F5D2D6D|nr:protein IQ-DOMAIN 19-like [Lolium rigidum]